MKFALLFVLGILVLNGIAHAQSGMPAQIMEKADQFVVSKVGQDFFNRYVSLNRSDYDKSSDTYLVMYDFRMPERPFVKGTMILRVDAGGNVEPGSDSGIPDCVKDVMECVFPIDAQRAIDIAKGAGLENGISGGLSARFGWFGGYGNVSARTYAWEVDNTLVDTETETSGRAVVIDANSGDVIMISPWGTTDLAAQSRRDGRYFSIGMVVALVSALALFKRKFIKKVVGFSARPSGSFEAAKGNPARDALKYFLGIALINSITMTAVLIYYSTGGSVPYWFESASAGFGVSEGFANALWAFPQIAVLAFVFNAAMLLSAIAIAHPAAYLAGARKGIAQTAKAAMYSSAPLLLLGLLLSVSYPMSGNVGSIGLVAIAALWAAFGHVGMRKFQELTAKGALLAVLSPLVVLAALLYLPSVL